MYGIEIPKQRGIFSEILTTEDTENLRVSTHSPLPTLFPLMSEAALIMLFFNVLRKYQPLDPMRMPCAKSTRFSRSPVPWESRERSSLRMPSRDSTLTLRLLERTSTAMDLSTKVITPRSVPTSQMSTPR